MIGGGFTLLDPTRITALNVNEGIITTGDNSAGMFTRGTNATSMNTGRITTGDYDISAFQPNQYSADVFALGRNGVGSSGTFLSEVINYGTITTGDGKVGASAQMTYDPFRLRARVIQNDAGVITTGDDSIGARVTGNHFAMLDNEGEISVGDDSVGVDITAGGALLYAGETTPTVTEGALQASNAGIIETGDNSVGVRMNGDREDVAVDWLDTSCTSPYYPYYGYQPVFGHGRHHQRFLPREQRHDPGGRQFHRGGDHRHGRATIKACTSSTPARSTPVRTAPSTAIRLNADNRIDSYVVNVGTIVGNVTFGARR